MEEDLKMTVMMETNMMEMDALNYVEYKKIILVKVDHLKRKALA